VGLAPPSPLCDSIGGRNICLHTSTVFGPVIRTITLRSEVGELTATMVSCSSYIRCFGIVFAGALHISEERLGFLLFDFSAGLARRGDQTLRLGLFFFPDVLANYVLLYDAGKSACHNVKVYAGRGLV